MDSRTFAGRSGWPCRTRRHHPGRVFICRTAAHDGRSAFCACRVLLKRASVTMLIELIRELFRLNLRISVAADYSGVAHVIQSCVSAIAALAVDMTAVMLTYRLLILVIVAVPYRAPPHRAACRMF